MKKVDPAERDNIELAGHLQAGRFHAVRSYHGIRAASLRPVDAELMHSLYPPLNWQCEALLLTGEGLGADDDHDRWFLCFCAEALYGDNYCPDLAAEIELAPPQPGNRTHMDKLGTVPDEECPGCGSSLADRENRRAQNPEDDLPVTLKKCPYCGTNKCCMCDMGDDVGCVSCNSEE